MQCLNEQGHFICLILPGFLRPPISSFRFFFASSVRWNAAAMKDMRSENKPLE